MPRIAITQLKCAVGDVEANVSKAEELISEAASQNADLVLLPEMFTTGFVGDGIGDVAEPIPGPTTERFSAAAAKHGIHVVAGMAELDGQSFYNAAVIIGPDGSLIHNYRKIYLYLGERDSVTPGSEACLVDLPFGRTGVSICYDYIFPHYIHGLVERGADLLLHPTAWVTSSDCERWKYPAPEAYRAQCMTRALENSVFFASSNLVGDCDPDGYIQGVGRSSVIAPWGEVLVEVEGEEGVGVADVDFSLSPKWREAAAPYIRDWHRTIKWPETATAQREA